MMYMWFSKHKQIWNLIATDPCVSVADEGQMQGKFHTYIVPKYIFHNNNNICKLFMKYSIDQPGLIKFTGSIQGNVFYI